MLMLAPLCDIVSWQFNKIYYRLSFTSPQSPVPMERAYSSVLMISLKVVQCTKRKCNQFA